MVQLRQQIQAEYHYSDYQMQQITYMFLSFLSETSKLIFMAAFFILIQKLPEFLVAVLALMSVRNFTGGIHLKHYSTCLLLSFSFFFLGICVLPNLIRLDTLEMLLILNLCIIAVYLSGPVLSVYRPPLTEEQKKSNSLKAATSILIYILIVFIFQKTSCLYAGFWVIVLQTLQLGLAKINLKMKGIKK